MLRAHRQLQILAQVALGRSSLHSLSLTAPRLLPLSATLPATGHIAGALRPFRATLWRRRARVVLLRALTLALVWLLLAQLPDLAFGLRLPVSLVWGPALLLCIAGIWLVIAQRPTILETAQLLDQRFRLHNVLGTALELDAGKVTGFLAERQVARAAAQLRSLPPAAWPVTGAREWQVPLVLLAGVVLASLAPSLSPSGTPGSLRAASSVRSRSILAQVVPALRTATIAGAHTQLPLPRRSQAHGSQPAAARFPDLGATLQVHAGPLQPASGSGNVALTPRGRQPGAANSATRGRIAQTGNSGTPGSSGTSGARTRSGGAMAGGQPGPPNQGSGSGATAVQAPQTGVQHTSGSSTARSNPAQGQNNSTSGSQSDQNGQDAQAGQNTGDTQQAQPHSGLNPFGPAVPSTGQKPASAPSRGTPRSRQAPRPGSPAQAKEGTSSRTNQAPTDQNGLDALPRRGTGAGPQTQQPAPHAGKAGPARGKQIILGGQYVLSPGATGPVLVRVVPPSAATGGELNGASGPGSGTVQGYVPENDTALSPEEQNLVRIYFSNGAGS
jgi:hypothetical protein